MSLRLHEVCLRRGSYFIHADVEFAEPVSGIVGPSGIGKTTLLDAIAGLTPIESGVIQFGPDVLNDVKTRRHVPPRQRRIGYLPQDLALFPHYSARRNLLYGMPRAETGAHGPFTLDHVIDTLDLRALLDRSVTTLSGGEKQRVALGRALLSRPRLLLLDEPMSSLDDALKERLTALLQRIAAEFPIPILYVSHAASEIAALCTAVYRFTRADTGAARLSR